MTSLKIECFNEYIVIILQELSWRDITRKCIYELNAHKCIYKQKSIYERLPVNQTLVSRVLTVYLYINIYLLNINTKTILATNVIYL